MNTITPSEDIQKKDERFFEYYITGKYKGFYKVCEKRYKITCNTQLKFSNGAKNIYASGSFKEEALHKIFESIDKCSMN